MARKSALSTADLTRGVEDDEPSLPGFAMSDEPFEAAVSEPLPTVQPPSGASALPTTGAVRYQSRIHIVDAWQYQGSLSVAPSFVDRNWASWGEYDEHRKLPAGPALRVPTPGPVAEKMCRIGDYVVKQSVTLAHGLDPEEHVDVWTRDEFEKLFLPSTGEPPASLPTQEPSHEDAPQES